MREHVVLRDAHCVFPGCRRDSRACDLDHINPYVPIDDGGPPGQTHPGNLAPLCRTHHRVKTHTAWDYQPHDQRSSTRGSLQQPVELKGGVLKKLSTDVEHPIDSVSGRI